MDMDMDWKWMDMNQNLCHLWGLFSMDAYGWIYLAGHQGTSSMAISGTDLLEAFAKFYGFIWGTSILGFRISPFIMINHYTLSIMILLVLSREWDGNGGGWDDYW